MIQVPPCWHDAVLFKVTATERVEFLSIIIFRTEQNTRRVLGAWKMPSAGVTRITQTQSQLIFTRSS